MRLALRVSARACGTPFALCLSLRGRDARKLSRPEISIDTSGIAIGIQFRNFWGNSIHRVFHLIILQSMATRRPLAFPLPSMQDVACFFPYPHFRISTFTRLSVQRWAKVDASGCVNAAGKVRLKWEATVTKFTKPGDCLFNRAL